MESEKLYMLNEPQGGNWEPAQRVERAIFLEGKISLFEARNGPSLKF